MLTRLSVSNYILIQDLRISFTGGFTIITGETGAGKSILLGALGLLSGARADSQALLDKQRKCIIEGKFSVSEYGLQEFFQEHELDYENECIMRREINAEGKSRAFVNDTPVNLNVLKQLGAKLIDIHSQHETLLLADSRFQMNLVDGMAGNSDLLAQWRRHYQDFKSKEQEIIRLREEETRSRSESDYLTFQLDEIRQLKLSKGEQAVLEAEQQKLENATEITASMSNAVQALRDADENVLSRLSSISQSISSLSKLDPRYQQWTERLQSIRIELKDIADEIGDSAGEVQPDPERLEKVNERLSTIYQLQKKHNLNGPDELLQFADKLAERLGHFESLEEQIATAEKEKDKLSNALLKTGTVLTESRNKVITRIEKEVVALLRDLSMPHAVLKINLTSLAQAGPDGMEKVQFLFSANKGGDYKELSKVASGGEMSRLMLAIKALMARHSAMPTLLFDEIDSGISGEAAAKAARILKEMARNHQIMAITHLPQIASKGDQHLFVYKDVQRGSTYSHIRQLSDDERIQEIARMLSGEQLSAAALENARELLNPATS